MNNCIKSAGIFFGFFILIVLLGQFCFSDAIIPVDGMEVEEWIRSFYFSGIAGLVVGWGIFCIWIYKGDGYSGEDNIESYYRGFTVVCLFVGIGMRFVFLKGAVISSSSIFADIIIFIAPVFGYYASSLVASPEAVKYIPFFSDKIHH